MASIIFDSIMEGVATPVLDLTLYQDGTSDYLFKRF